jgi:hypothetical protein
MRKRALDLRDEIDALRAEARRNITEPAELRRIEHALRIKMTEIQALKLELAASHPLAADMLIPGRYSRSSNN